MFLELSNLTDEQLIQKKNTLITRLRQMQFNGGNNKAMYEQAINFIEQIDIELEERQAFATIEKPGVVDIVGEDSEEAQEFLDQKERERKKNG